MPTETGAETIGERLVRLRERLALVRATIDRSLQNGQSFSMAGTAVTQIASEHAQSEERRLQREIGELEARLAGVRAPAAVAQTVTRMP